MIRYLYTNPDLEGLDTDNEGLGKDNEGHYGFRKQLLVLLDNEPVVKHICGQGYWKIIV